MSSKDKDKRKIIIVKKKSAGHAGHHGGSWKVAYADFVTAMMAFFMVMWLLGLNDSTKKNIEGYFQNPRGFKDLAGAGTTPIVGGETPAQKNAPTPPTAKLLRQLELERFRRVGDRLRTLVYKAPELKGFGAQIEISVGPEGLRIELVDAGGDSDFFPRGSAQMMERTAAVLRVIARELAPLPNYIVMEGHTDAVQYSTLDGYTNWELSAERANSARRVLLRNGVADSRVREVRGYADRSPRNAADPRAPQNRRISILVPYSGMDGAGSSSFDGPGAHAGPGAATMPPGATDASEQMPGVNTLKASTEPTPDAAHGPSRAARH